MRGFSAPDKRIRMGIDGISFFISSIFLCVNMILHQMNCFCHISYATVVQQKESKMNIKKSGMKLNGVMFGFMVSWH